VFLLIVLYYANIVINAVVPQSERLEVWEFLGLFAGLISLGGFAFLYLELRRRGDISKDAPPSFRDLIEHTDKPTFVVSLNTQLVANLSMGIVLLLVATSFFLRGDSVWVGGLFPLFVALIPFYSFVKYQRASIKSGRFYEDHFVVTERKQTRDFQYDQIRKVELTSASLAPMNRLQIYFKGQEAPLVLVRNPPSKSLKTDLFSWLRSKSIEEASAPERGQS
jgi:hypothetical protein